MGRDAHRNGRTEPIPPRAHLDLGTGGAGAALLFHIQLLGKEHPEEGPGGGKRRSLEVQVNLGCLPGGGAVEVSGTQRSCCTHVVLSEGWWV